MANARRFISKIILISAALLLSPLNPSAHASTMVLSLYSGPLSYNGIYSLTIRADGTAAANASCIGTYANTTIPPTQTYMAGSLVRYFHFAGRVDSSTGGLFELRCSSEGFLYLMPNPYTNGILISGSSTSVPSTPPPSNSFMMGWAMNAAGSSTWSRTGVPPATLAHKLNCINCQDPSEIFEHGVADSALATRYRTIESYADLADPAFPTGNSSRTLMGWVKINGSVQQKRYEFFGHGGSSLIEGDYFGFAADYVSTEWGQLFLHIGGVPQVIGPILEANRWYKVTAVKDYDNVRLFVNGLEWSKGAVCDGSPSAAPECGIGNRVKTNTPSPGRMSFAENFLAPQDVSIDEIRLLNYAASEGVFEAMLNRAVGFGTVLNSFMRLFDGDQPFSDSVVGEPLFSNGIPPNLAPGYIGNAYDFTKNLGDSYLLSSSAAILAGQMPREIAGWVNVDSFPTSDDTHVFGFDVPEYGYVGDKRVRNSDKTLSVVTRVIAGSRRFCATNYLFWVCSNEAIVKGRWYHVGASYVATSTGTISLFVDGVFKARQTNAKVNLPAQSRIAIGGLPLTRGNVPRFTNGLIDGVRYFSGSGFIVPVYNSER